MNWRHWWKNYGQFIDLMIPTFVLWGGIYIVFNHFLFHWEIHKYLSTMSIGYFYSALGLGAFLIVFLISVVVDALKKHPPEVITDINNKKL